MQDPGSQHDSQAKTPPSGALAIRWCFPDATGTLTRLVSRQLVLGRGDDCNVQIPGNETSRYHAEIRRDGPVRIVSDRNSKNGVFVNGVRVREAALSPGDLIRLGEWIGVVVVVPRDFVDREPVFDVFAERLAGGPALRPILDRANKAAPTALPTVLVGETGTGKHTLAKIIHQWSGRKGPFVTVNCFSLVPAFIDAELFGFRQGEPSSKPAGVGAFRAAQGGTLLLDEVTALPSAAQAKILRVLQRREVFPLGETKPMPIDVHVLASTQVPLADAVAQRRFRPDLAARLGGLTVAMPPLRERKEEIPFLLGYLIHRHHSGAPPLLDPRLVEQLCLYDWPYNVRELDQLVRTLLVQLRDEPQWRRQHLPVHVLRRPDGTVAPATDDGHPHKPSSAPTVVRMKSEHEIAIIREALRVNKGNVAATAAAIGIARQDVYQRMEASDVRDPDDGLAAPADGGPIIGE
jgi:DNA-binding NtrC family response regulator